MCTASVWDSSHFGPNLPLDMRASVVYQIQAYGLAVGAWVPRLAPLRYRRSRVPFPSEMVVATAYQASSRLGERGIYE